MPETQFSSSPNDVGACVGLASDSSRETGFELISYADPQGIGHEKVPPISQFFTLCLRRWRKPANYMGEPGCDALRWGALFYG